MVFSIKLNFNSLECLIGFLIGKKFFKNEYFNFMLTYEELSHVRKLDTDLVLSHLSQYYFISHHGVLQHGKKFRVFFNGSFPDSNGISLNNSLYAGPPLQTDLTYILMRWRSF